MIWEVGTVAKNLFLPPVLWGWLLLYGVVRFRSQPRRARWVLGLGIGLLYLSATPLVSGLLVDLVADDSASAVVYDAKSAQAVVILAGGRALQFDANGNVLRARLGPSTSERVIEGVRIARETGLPILVSSGKPDGFDPAEGVVMRDVMVREFGIAPRWVELESRNTVENAQFSAPILKAAGIKRVILVTHGYHMRRARYLFERVGISVTPAVVDPRANTPFGWGRLLRSLVPTAGAVSTTFLACNEIGGMVYAWSSTRPAASATPAAAVAN